MKGTGSIQRDCFFGSPSSYKAKLIFFIRTGICSPSGKPMHVSQCIYCLGASREILYWRQSEMFTHFFFLKQKQSFTNKFGKLSYLNCFPFQRRGAQYWIQGERFFQKVLIFLVMERKNPLLGHNGHKISFIL